MVHYACLYLGVSGYNFLKKYFILLSEDLFLTFSNSVDPDDTVLQVCSCLSGVETYLLALCCRVVAV